MLFLILLIVLFASRRRCYWGYYSPRWYGPYGTGYGRPYAGPYPYQDTYAYGYANPYAYPPFWPYRRGCW